MRRVIALLLQLHHIIVELSLRINRLWMSPLTERGADVGCQDYSGRTVLDLSVAYSSKRSSSPLEACSKPERGECKITQRQG
jgi:hypothetical protein